MIRSWRNLEDYKQPPMEAQLDACHEVDMSDLIAFAQ